MADVPTGTNDPGHSLPGGPSTGTPPPQGGPTTSPPPTGGPSVQKPPGWNYIYLTLVGQIFVSSGHNPDILTEAMLDFVASLADRIIAKYPASFGK